MKHLFSKLSKNMVSTALAIALLMASSALAVNAGAKLPESVICHDNAGLIADAIKLNVSPVGWYDDSRPAETSINKSKENKSRKSRLWSVAFCLGGHFCSPGGQMYGGLEAGLGFDAEVLLTLTRRLALRGIVCESGIHEPSEWNNIPLSDSTGYRSYSYKSMKYALLLSYYHRPYRETSAKIIYHFSCGLGLVTHEMDRDEVYVSDGVEVSRQTTTFSDTRPALILGIGLTHMVGQVVGIHAGADFDLVWPD